MRKSELIAALNEIEGDPIVLVSSDEEGNDFTTLGDVELSDYVNEDYTWNVLHPTDVAEYVEDGADVRKAIVLWP